MNDSGLDNVVTKPVAFPLPVNCQAVGMAVFSSQFLKEESGISEHLHVDI